MHRKIELQSPADYTYLYANTTNLSRQKLDLHLPPSASNSNDAGDDAPDPMRERVRELVDEYITKTFTTASTSLNVNGLDDDHQFPLPTTTTAASTSLQAPAETVEYEPFDTDLAARVTSLYAQLESLTTTVAQLRRDAPRKAAGLYAEELKRVLGEDDEGDGEGEDEDYDYGYDYTGDGGEGANKQEEDVDMADAGEQGQPRQRPRSQSQSRKTIKKPDWKIHVPLSSEAETQRWRNGEMAEVYGDTLRTLLRLQGEADEVDGNALATTVGKAERAGRAADVVENM